jgi:hypothetical protein
MNDREHFKLLFGPYAPPKIPRNQRLFCEVRGSLKVGSWSDGLIPWPRRFSQEEDAVLKSLSNLVAARKLGRNIQVVAARRRYLASKARL